jgi:hypothetical protein
MLIEQWHPHKIVLFVQHENDKERPKIFFFSFFKNLFLLERILSVPILRTRIQTKTCFFAFLFFSRHSFLRFYSRIYHMGYVCVSLSSDMTCLVVNACIHCAECFSKQEKNRSNAKNKMKKTRANNYNLIYVSKSVFYFTAYLS